MSTRRWYLSLAAVAAAALLLRLLNLADLAGTTLASVLMGDGRVYDAWATQLASGQWLGTDVFYQAPLYPYLLGVFYAAAGHSVAAVRVAQAAGGALSCVLLAAAGRRFFSARVGLVAGAMLVCYPAAIFFDALVQKASLDLLLMTIVLASAGAFYAHQRRRWLLVLGLTLGLFMLNRENTRVLYPVLAGWLVLGFGRETWRQRLTWVAVFTAAVVAALAPVAIRNYYVGGELLISTSQAGPNFYIGNHSGARGSYDPLLPDRGDPVFERTDATQLAEKAAGRKLAPGEVSSYWTRRTFEDIRSSPWAWIKLMGWKLLLTLNAQELVDTESVTAYAEDSRVIGGLLWFNFGIVLPLAAIGVSRSRARWRDLGILYAIALGFALSMALFYVVARYRHPLVPIVLLFAAAAVAAIPELFPGRPAAAPEMSRKSRRQARVEHGDAPVDPASAKARWRAWMPALAVGACVAVVANLPLRLTEDATYLNVGTELLKAGRPADAVPFLQRAVAVSPDYARARLALGDALIRTSRPDEAIPYLEQALRLTPESGTAHNALGLALSKAGRPQDALAHLVEAVRLDPRTSAPHTNLGMALWQVGRQAEAVEQYREAQRLEPDNATVENNLGATLQQLGDPAGALPFLEKAVQLKPDYAEAHANLASSLQATGEGPKALTHLGEAIRLQPGNFALHANMGQLLLDAGRKAEALGQFEEASRLAPGSSKIGVMLANAYVQNGRVDAARTVLERTLTVARADGDVALVRELEMTLGALAPSVKR